MSMIRLKEIQDNYQKAYKDRRVDLSILRKKNRKSMTMHLAGVYIECLLKSIIIKENNIIKTATFRNGSIRIIGWYNKKDVDKISLINSPDAQAYDSNKTTVNPGHSLIQLIKLISIFDAMPSDIENSIRMIDKPINNKKFIDLRYMSDCDISNDQYNLWEIEFIKFVTYYEKNKKRLSFVI